jgi:hypothetical protein
MKPSRLLLALCLSLSACASTKPAPAPSQIPPPPVALVSACPVPAPLGSEATARELVEWTMLWIRTAVCENAKRRALIDAWPQ